MKMWSLATLQEPSKTTGLRSTRWVVIRNTFPELKGTTIKTWLDWFPEDQYGRFYWDRPYRHHVRVGDIDMEVSFLALDSEEDVKKLRSMEYTGCWFNELEFIDKAVFDEAESRTGRFPAVKDGGSTWHGVLADMNAPREDHWIPLMMGEVPLPDDWTEDERAAYRKPDTWGYFVQPPALREVKGADGRVAGYLVNPDAENTRWLKAGFYSEVIKGKTKQWIDSRVLNKITVFVDGKPVWPSFNPEVHVASTALQPVPGWKVFVGLDFGRSPAAVFGQLINNRWSVQHELIGRDEGATTFAPKVGRVLEQFYPGYEVDIIGDPKGQDGTQAGEVTAYDVFRAHGLPVRPAPVKQNNIEIRLGAVDYELTRMVEGLPAFLLSPECRVLKVGMSGGYHFKRIGGTSRHKEEPEKDRYSNPADALQYMVLGAGGGRAMTGFEREGRRTPVDTTPRRRSRRRGVVA